MGSTYDSCNTKLVFHDHSYRGDSPKYPMVIGPFDRNGLLVVRNRSIRLMMLEDATGTCSPRSDALDRSVGEQEE